MEEPNSPSDTQGLGKVMAILTWILVLILLMLFFNHWKNIKQLNTQIQVTTAEGVQQTILKRNDNNQYVVQGSINGKPVVFLLDTGATEVVIPEELAKDLKLTAGLQGVAGTAAGNVVIYDTTISELTLGHIILRNVKASISPSFKGKQILLGMSALRKIHFIQDDDTLILTVKK
jgi:aspartyl protease family protein